MSKRRESQNTITIDDLLGSQSSKHNLGSVSKSPNQKADDEILDDFVKSQQGKYISKEEDKYVVSRVIRGKRKIFGTFTLLEYAEEYEHDLIINGWDENFRGPKSSYGKFISKIKSRYYIIREFQGKKKRFGSYNTLLDALLKREELIDDNWGVDGEINPNIKSRYGRYITYFDGKFVVNKVFDGEIYNFGYFETLEDATSARDILVENNWDENKVPYNLYSLRYFIRYHFLTKSWKIINPKGEDIKFFGLFKTYDYAKEALSILIDNDWNMGYVPLEYYHKYSNIRRFKRRNGDIYSIIRRINGELKSFGSFEDYDEALEFRNELYLNNWALTEQEEEKFDEYIYLKDGKFIVKNNDIVYGEFDDSSDAIDFRLECIKNKWNINDV